MSDPQNPGGGRKPLLAKPLARKPAPDASTLVSNQPAPVAPAEQAAPVETPAPAAAPAPAAPAPAAPAPAAPAPAAPAAPPGAGPVAAPAAASGLPPGLRAAADKVGLGEAAEKLGKGPLMAMAAFVGFLVLGGGYFMCSSSGAAGKAVMNSSKPVTGASALGSGAMPPCKDVKEQRITPLVVDWSSDERTELELAMKDGLAVVEYTCENLRILQDCKVDGSYRFSGVQPKEEVRQLASADEFAANLPKSATGKLGASLSTELARGNALDIATITVGRKRTARDEVTRADLKGKCAGATHLVRGASVGAFAKDVGQKGKVKGAAEVFGSGSTTTSTASAMSKSTDGSIAACKKATADDPKPPPQCGSVVVLELIPITAKATGKQASSEAVGACPVGMVYAGSKCVKKEEATSFQCEEGDFKTCKEQCGKGNAGSCHFLGKIQYYNTTIDGKPNPNYSWPESEAAFQKACTAGHKGGCSYVAYMQLMQGKIDGPKAQKIMAEGVAEGDNSSRTNLGWLMAGLTPTNAAGKPLGIPLDFDRGLAMMARACDAGDSEGCWGMGAAIITHLGAHQKVSLPNEQIDYATKANAYYCQRDVKNCYNAGMLALIGSPPKPLDQITAEEIASRTPDAAPSFIRACSAPPQPSCANLKALAPAFADAKKKLDAACQGGNKASCDNAAKVAALLKVAK